jgi:hypothetical protein
MGRLSVQERPMTPSEITCGISAADLGRPALRCLRLFDLAPDFFDLLRAECVELYRAERPSDVGNRNHVTHWTRPRGVVLQFSLLNSTGRYDDTTTDHDESSLGKTFHAACAYPSLARLVSAFPHSINFRLNVLGPGATLSAHKETVCFKAKNGAIGLRIRLHLPVVTNDAAELALDDHVYHFPARQIILFNQGCVHSAINKGAADRLHLVWDTLLTRSAAQLLFGGEPIPFPAERCPPSRRYLAPISTETCSSFLSLSPLVDSSELTNVQLIDPQ